MVYEIANRLKNYAPYFMKIKKILYHNALKFIKKWANEQVDEDEQRLRTFCAFYMFHETVNPLEVAGFLHDNYVEAKCIGLTLKNLRNPLYYNTLLPSKMQTIFTRESPDATPSEEEEKSLTIIKNKIKSIIQMILDDANCEDILKGIPRGFPELYTNNTYLAGFGSTEYLDVSYSEYEREDSFSKLSLFINPKNEVIHKYLMSSQREKHFVTEERLNQLADRNYPTTIFKKV